MTRLEFVKNTCFIFNYLYVCLGEVYVHSIGVVLKAHKGIWDSLQIELVILPTGVLGTQLQSLTTVFNQIAISPIPRNIVFKTFMANSWVNTVVKGY